MSDTIQHPDLCQYPGCTQPRPRLQNYCLLHRGTTPPDQPEDAALRQQLAKLFTDSHTPWPDMKPIEWPNTFADKVMQLFHAHEQEKVQAARIDELNGVEKYIPGSFQGYNSAGEPEYMLTNPMIEERVATINGTQPPAADTTKQGEGDE